MPRLAGVVSTLYLFSSLLVATARADDARAPATQAPKQPEVSTIRPAVVLSAEQRQALAEKDAARRAAEAAAAASAQAPLDPSGKPADVKTVLPGPANVDPATLETLRQQKEAQARQQAALAPRPTPRQMSFADVLGPIPRPAWVHDLLKLWVPTSATNLDPRRPADARAGVAAPAADASKPGRPLGVKAPEVRKIESGPATPSAAELAKRPATKAGGGAR